MADAAPAHKLVGVIRLYDLAEAERGSLHAKQYEQPAIVANNPTRPKRFNACAK